MAKTGAGSPSTALQRHRPSVPADRRARDGVARRHSPLPFIALGVAGFVALGSLATKRLTVTVPAALTVEAHAALVRAGLPVAPFVLDGRDVVVGGQLADDSLFPQVTSVLGAVPGIRVVVQESTERAHVRMRWTPDSFSVDGRVPADRAGAFREKVARLAASRVIDDRGRAARLDTPDWWDGLENVDSIPVLVQSGILRLEESIVSLEGFVADAPARGRVIGELEKAFPGFRIIERLRLVRSATELQPLIDEAMGTSVVDFVTGDARLSRDSRNALARVAEVLLRTPEIGLEIVAHLDWSGNPEIDRRRSETRARAVSDDLISRGVSADRLYTVGAGSDDPLQEGSSSQVRMRNRRVELRSVLLPPS